MKLDAIVVSGITDQALAKGPGHDPLSSPPGEGNCVIAGHRNAAGWWFYRINQLKPGDFVYLDTRVNLFSYIVKKVTVVDGNDQKPLRLKPPIPLLTLYSCTLPKSTRRVVVVAELYARL